jgi:hypothetical protein
MIGVKTGTIIGLSEPQPVGVKFAMRHASIVHVVEDAEFHR